MKSSAFENFHLSDHERFVRAHHDDLRQLLPVMDLPEPPPSAELATVNATLKRVQLSCQKRSDTITGGNP
jgi:hypothetical protein